LKEKRITYTPSVLKGRFNRLPEDIGFFKAINHNKKLVNVLKNKMFKGYGKVNTILQEKLNSVEPLRNISNNFYSSNEFNRLGNRENSKVNKDSYNLNNNNNNLDDFNKYENNNNYEKDPMKNNKNNNILKHDNFNEKYKKSDNILSNEIISKNIDEIDSNTKKNTITKKIKKKKNKKLQGYDTNPLNLHVNHIPKTNYKVVKVKDEVTEINNISNYKKLFLTDNNSEILLMDNKKKSKNKHDISYISNISQVNHIKFFAFDVKNPGYKEHFNNKIVQIEKEISKEIGLLNKEKERAQPKLDKTENFFDIDRSKIFDLTKRNKSAQNPNFYGRTTSNQNFKTNPGLIRGFLKNFKNNKLLIEFFKYKREKDKRERFNIQSYDISSFKNMPVQNPNKDYVETYFIGKNVNGNINKTASITQKNFLKKNDLNKMDNYINAILKDNKINQEEKSNLNHLNKDLFLDKEFIKEFNEYALANGNEKVFESPNKNDNEGIMSDKDISEKLISESLIKNKINKYFNYEDFKLSSNIKVEIDNDNIYHNDDLQKKNIFSHYENSSSLNPDQYKFINHSEKKPHPTFFNDKFNRLNEKYFDDKYVEENFYEEPINKGEGKEFVLNVHDPKLTLKDSINKEKEKIHSNEIDENNIKYDNNHDSKIEKNLENRNNDLINKFEKGGNLLNEDIKYNKAIVNKEKIKSKLLVIETVPEENKSHAELNTAHNFKENMSKKYYDFYNTNTINTNANRDLRTNTNENPTEILQSGISSEGPILIPKQDDTEDVYFNSNNYNNYNNNIFSDNINYELYSRNSNINKDLISCSNLKTNLRGKNSNNKIYENLQKRNNFNYNPLKILNSNSFQNEYYKPLSDKLSKNNFRNIQKNKFNRLKDIVFSQNDEEYKQNLIKGHNYKIGGYSSSNSIYQNKIYSKTPPGPILQKSKSPLKSLINNQMGIYLFNESNYLENK